MVLNLHLKKDFHSNIMFVYHLFVWIEIYNARAQPAQYLFQQQLHFLTF